MSDHYRVFERAAFAYRWFYPIQVRWYETILSRNIECLEENRSFLDVGCGTGAFSRALSDRGFSVTGLDRSPSMARYGRLNEVSCVIGDIFQGLPFRDKSFDAVSAAYVAHGFSARDRIILYRECARVARNLVLFHDFNRKKRFFISLVERLEGSDYDNFIKDAPDEMGAIFSSVTVIEAGPVNNWYLCRP